MNYSSKFKRAIKALALFPIQPRMFRVYVEILRELKLLPEFKKEVTRSKTRVLIIALTKHVGDVVMMMPLIEKLGTGGSMIEVEVAVASNMEFLLAAIPSIAKVHGVDVGPASPPILNRYLHVMRLIRYARRVLARGDYDICLLVRWGVDPALSSYLAYMTNAPVRCGQDPREEVGAINEFPGTEELMTIAVRGGHGLPEAIRHLRLLPAVGLLSFVDEKAAERKNTQSLTTLAESIDWKALCDRLCIPHDLRYGVIAPGASHPSRVWPASRYAEVVLALADEYNMSFLIVGSWAEKALGREIELLSPRGISLVGTTSLFETIAIIRRSKLFVGNDSGPGHIAAGLGVPSIIISSWPEDCRKEGPTSPLRVRPVGSDYVVLQPKTAQWPCVCGCQSTEAHCILGVQSVDVIRACRGMATEGSHTNT
jgi:ADP-heptose:LPS heptosyltransferase